MSREIKFSAWDAKNKLWVYLFVHQGMTEMRGGGPGTAHLGEWEQFTGLRDKNGKEIYEGDIITTADDGACVVIFRRGAFGCEVSREELMGENGYEVCDKFIPFSDDDLAMGFDKQEPIPNTVFALEVIGNIHENPELVKP